jgi:hypothetical protein
MTAGNAPSPGAKPRRDRRSYLVAAIVLLLVEIAIALFVKSGFVRHTLGDVLVVMLLYAALMAAIRLKPVLAALLCFAFACVVEGAQALNIVERLGLGDVALARIVIGTTFSPWDLVAYFAGAIVAVFIDARMRTN